MALVQAADIVELAMHVEQSGEAFYRAVAPKSQTAEIRALFEDLAEQEVIHYKVFFKLSQTVRDTPLMTDEEWDMYLSYIKGTVNSAFFEGPGKALALAETVTDERQAIDMAIGFEKETLLFFYELRDRLPEQDRSFVDKIVAEERRHIRRLSRML